MEFPRFVEIEQKLYPRRAADVWRHGEEHASSSTEACDTSRGTLQ